MRIGSNEHKELFCRTFIETHVVYEPETLPWPALDDVMLAQLRALPIWGTALQIESNAGVMVTGFAKTLDDPVIRDAVLLQGAEEQRHARLIATMIERYGLSADAQAPALELTERAFIDFGCGECIDSFLGFGFFALVRESGLAPDALLSIFDRVLWEEARHILFFVNWMAYERAQRAGRARLRHALASGRGYGRALLNIATIARSAADGSATPRADDLPKVFSGLTLPKFLAACVAENERHMARFDPRLLRPRLMPALARTAVGTALAARFLDRLASKPLL